MASTDLLSYAICVLNRPPFSPHIFFQTNRWHILLYIYFNIKFPAESFNVNIKISALFLSIPFLYNTPWKDCCTAFRSFWEKNARTDSWHPILVEVGFLI